MGGKVMEEVGKKRGSGIYLIQEQLIFREHSWMQTNFQSEDMFISLSSVPMQSQDKNGWNIENRFDVKLSLAWGPQVEVLTISFPFPTFRIS